MRVAILSPIAWRTPPRKYGPWEQVASNIAEGLIAKGIDVTLFATGDSLTKGKLNSVFDHPYGEDHAVDPKVWESLHISNVMEHAHEFDIIHNHFDFLPLTYSQLIDTPLVTTIHGFSSPQIIPVYKKYNHSSSYVSISKADRHPDLHYLRTIYHGINPSDFSFNEGKGNYLLYFGRIHPEKGAHTAIEIAKRAKYPLKMAGLIQDQNYFDSLIKPYINNDQVEYMGNVDPLLRNEILGNARALLHPISFDEPFGLSIVEAMMCGTPVIAFNRGSMAELIVDGITGYLVNDSSEAIEAIAQLNRIKRVACRDHALSKFSIDRMADEYIQVYTEILQKQ